MEARKCFQFLDIPIDEYGMSETVKKVIDGIDYHRQKDTAGYVATVNLDFLVNVLSGDVRMRQRFKMALQSADIVTADGMPVLWLSQLLGHPIRERVDGAGLVPLVLEQLAIQGGSIFLLGGESETTAKAAQRISEQYPKIHIVGVATPWIDSTVDKEAIDEIILEQLEQTTPDLLLIGLGSPKQELWWLRVRDRLKVPMSMGVGGTLKFLAGFTSRAPQWMQRYGLEWCYRWFQEPKNLTRRYLRDIFYFPILAGYALHQRWSKRE